MHVKLLTLCLAFSEHPVNVAIVVAVIAVDPNVNSDFLWVLG